jgi:biotin operon repressor
MTIISKPLTQAILEALHKRAGSLGDEWQVNEAKQQVTVRCFQPDKHQNGDAHPSARYHLGKYVYCGVCKFTKGEARLANRLGVGDFSEGLTLEALANAKALPMDLLQSLGWRTQVVKSKRAAVFIPWYPVKQTSDSMRTPYHVRHYINKDDGLGPRFTWDIPKKVYLDPYGGWHIPDWLEEAEVRQLEPYIFITESEVDSVSFWLHGIPAIATGGNEGWRTWWLTYLGDFKRFYICQEPDSAGEAMAQRVGSNIVDRMPTAQVFKMAFPPDIKDANALHEKCAGDTEQFRLHITSLMEKATNLTEVYVGLAQQKQVAKELEAEALHQSAKELLHSPDLLYRAIQTGKALGIVGEERNIGLVHLTFRSRALPRPANLKVDSPSNSGKTYLIEKTAQLECPAAFYQLTAGSERSLIYTDEPLKHRILYIPEPDGLPEGAGAATLKTLIWEGKFVYETVIKGPEDEFIVQHIEKEGPTGLILCTTKPIEEQLSNRMEPIETDSSPEQTQKILNQIARNADEGQTEVDLAPCQALSQVLGDPVDVQVPFAQLLPEHISATALRLRRDFSQLLNFIKASAVEYRYQRSLAPDGRVVANIADYAHVYALANEMFIALQGEGVTTKDREAVAALADLVKENGSKGVSQSALRDKLKLSKGPVSHRVKRLLAEGYIINEADKGKPMILKPGTELPGKASPLPSPCKIAQQLIEQGKSELVVTWVDPITGKWHDCHSGGCFIGMHGNFSATATETPETPNRPLNIVSGNNCFVSEVAIETSNTPGELQAGFGGVSMGVSLVPESSTYLGFQGFNGFKGVRPANFSTHSTEYSTQPPAVSAPPGLDESLPQSTDEADEEMTEWIA